MLHEAKTTVEQQKAEVKAARQATELMPALKADPAAVKQLTEDLDKALARVHELEVTLGRLDPQRPEALQVPSRSTLAGSDT